MFVACHSEVGSPARSGTSAVLFVLTVTYMMARWITGVADDGRRPHAGVRVNRGEEHDHDDRRDEEIPPEALPEILVFFVVFFLSRPVAGHGPGSQGWESV